MPLRVKLMLEDLNKMSNKPIYFSEHSKQQMKLRGALAEEVTLAIRSANWQTAKQNRLRCRFQFPFNAISPMNQRFYPFKTIEVVFAEKPERIEVITVKVYYYN